MEDDDNIGTYHEAIEIKVDLMMRQFFYYHNNFLLKS